MNTMLTPQIYWTYPPPSNNICCGLDSRLEVLLEFITRALRSDILLLNGLNGIEEI
jgi:hypothetical protein